MSSHRSVLLPKLLVATALLSLGFHKCQPVPICENVCDESSCVVDGLLNVPRGNASLRIDDDCNLVVDDIGQSGSDGVAQIELDSIYMMTELDTPNLSLSSIGTQVTIEQLGFAGGVANQEIMLTRLINFDRNRIKLSVTCSGIGVQEYDISIFDGEALTGYQSLGAELPVLIYPKEDLLSIACGIWNNGDVYTEMIFAAAQPFTIISLGADPGPFVGDMLFITGRMPTSIPTSQTAIENTFVATGPVTMTSMFVSGCYGDFSGDSRVDFRDLAGFRACRRCEGLTCDPLCDADGDGEVNRSEARAFRRNFGQACTAP